MNYDKKYTLIRRIAGGKHSAPSSIRSAAVRLMTGFSDQEDETLVDNYLSSMYPDDEKQDAGYDAETTQP